MKKFLLFASLCAILVSCGAAKKLVPQKNKSFTFVQMSDPQLGFYEHPYGVFDRGEKFLYRTIGEINSLHPSFVVVTGDLCDQHDHQAQYEAYVKAMKTVSSDIPVYTVPGNHDIDGYSAAELERYRSKFGPEKFSFKYNNCTFIGFDSNCIKGGDAEAEAQQYAWLRQQLSAAKGSRYIFLFCHCPLTYCNNPALPDDYNNWPMERRWKYIDLFKEFGVTALFSGHLHQPVKAEYQGTFHYICGSSGTTLEDSPSGYHVIDINDKGYTVNFVSLKNQD